MMFYRWKFKRAAVSAGMAARSGGKEAISSQHSAFSPQAF